MTLLEEAKALLPTLVKHRRFFHGVAEVGTLTKKTNAYIKKELARLGISVCDCGGGVLATVKEGKGGILLRADTDALPIKEESGLSFSAEGGSAHACGHDLHAAMLLGTAELLAGHKRELSHGVTLMFQNAEETLGGALSMIEDGALASSPAYAYALHVLTASELPTGTVLIPPAGVSTAASDFFYVDFFGRGAHGAMPERSVNPLVPLSHALLALEGLLPREVGSEKQAVMSVCLLEGGGALNAVPDKARLGGSFRTHDAQTRAFLLSRIPRLCEGIADPFGVKTAFTHEAFCPALFISAEARAHALSQIARFCADASVKELPPFCEKPRGGSEDFSFVAERVPSLFLSLAAGSKRDGYNHPLHHPKVRFDENALPCGAALLAGLAM